MHTSLAAVEDWILHAIADLPGVEVVPYPDWGAQTFQVGGKHFARVGGGRDGGRLLTIKGDPDDNAALVAEFEGVTPGYYANKRLWISIDLDAAVPRDIIIEALHSGYAIVRSSLPKRVQAELGDWSG
jgi:predicted DNA-binding protein (MmcQ/YjbR family)